MIGDNAWCVSLVYLLKDDVGGVANSASNCSGAMIMERSSLHLNGYCKETDTGNGTLETVPSRLETNAHCSSHAMSHAVADHCAAGLGSTSGLDLRLMFAVPLASDDLCAVCWSHNEILATCCTTGHPGSSQISKKFKMRRKPLTQIFMISMTFATPAPSPAVGITDRDRTADCPIRARAGPCGQQPVIG